jgi:hypothetical protein
MSENAIANLQAEHFLECQFHQIAAGKPELLFSEVRAVGTAVRTVAICVIMSMFIMTVTVVYDVKLLAPMGLTCILICYVRAGHGQLL